MVFGRRAGRKYLIISVFLVVSLYFLCGPYFGISSDFVTKYRSSVEHEKIVQARAHFHEIFDLIKASKPELDGKGIVLNKYKDDNTARMKAFSDKLPVYSNEEEYLLVSEQQQAILKAQHKRFVDGIPKTVPEGIFSGTGAVTTTGGKHIPVFIVTLKMLRKVSPNIPVEVFMVNRTEYEPHICEELLPSLNAKCVFFSDMFGQDILDKFDIKGYQYKAMSILASSFEDVVFIDSDSVPIRDVAKIFNTDVYKNNGFISWPDYWFRTVSPHYFEIADVKLGERVRGDLSETDPTQIPQADLKNAIPDKSTESGQMFFSKKYHYRALLLSLYYNIYGYDIYYPLFSQGSAGEGDKETFRAATVILNEHPSYQVNTDIYPYGHKRPDGEFKGVALPQADPDQDYRKFILGEHEDQIPSCMFLHLNAYKFDPKGLFTHDEIKEFYLSEDDNKRIRILGNVTSISTRNPLANDDVELELWKEVTWFTCNVSLGNNVIIQWWEDIVDKLPHYCKLCEQQLAWLESTTLETPKDQAPYNW